MLAVIIPAAILSLILFFAVSLRGRDGADLSSVGLVRLYLYVASLAAVVLFVIGAASLVNVASATIVGEDFTYGRSPEGYFHIPAPCPPNMPDCEAARAHDIAVNPRDRIQEQRDRLRGDDLVRGITFTVIGALIWGAHWSARRRFGADDRVSSMRRGYLMAGTLLFGLVTVVLLPWGMYQALATWILPPSPTLFIATAETLTSGVAALPVWLIYLRLVLHEAASQSAGPEKLIGH